MTLSRDSYCSYCGAPFEADSEWPRTCPRCGQTTFRNPLPVAVILLPVDEGLLTVRRGIDPGRGKLALPGGFIEFGESWQAAAARELDEETGITIAPVDVRLFDAHSAPDGTLLIFGLAPAWRAADLPPFRPTAEAVERVIIAAPSTLAFSLHTTVAQTYFAQRQS